MADDKPQGLIAELKEIEAGAGNSAVQDAKPKSNVTPLNCFLGAIVAGTIGFFLYRSTVGVAVTFARTQIHSDNFIVMRMSAAIRTLVIGMFAMGTGVFGLAAFGLAGLGIQTIFKKAPDLPSDAE